MKAATESERSAGELRRTAPATPLPMPSTIASSNPAPISSTVGPRRDSTRPSTGSPVPLQRKAEIAAQRLRQPGEILHRQRLVEAEARAQFGHVLRRHRRGWD